MPDLFEKLKEMESSSKGKIGWRPLGDAQRDSYGARRGHLLECKMRLEALKEDLERKIKVCSSKMSKKFILFFRRAHQVHQIKICAVLNFTSNQLLYIDILYIFQYTYFYVILSIKFFSDV